MISFVYLDVGGVALLDFSGTNKWDEVQAELGVAEDKRAEFKSFWTVHASQICTTMTPEQMLPLLQSQFNLTLPENYSLLNAFVSRFEPNPAIWPIVNDIKQVVPVGLLTNMYIGMFDAIQQADLLQKADWDVVIDSSIEGCQKPEAKIFEVARSRAGVPGDQILFVDNSDEHVRAARDFGWQTFLYNPSNPQQSSEKLLAFFQKALHA